MDPLALLEQDHRTVEDLFARIESAEGAARQPLIEELVAALHAHMQLEEDLLYPIVLETLGEKDATEANTEHSLARDGLTKLSELSPDEPGFGAAMDMVKAGIQHHVDEEETQMFPELRDKAGGDLDRISEQFVGKRGELGLPTEADPSKLTKEQLYEEAARAGVEGRSTMTKEELAREVSSS